MSAHTDQQKNMPLTREEEGSSLLLQTEIYVIFKGHSHSAGPNWFSPPLRAAHSSTTAKTFMSSFVTDTPQFVFSELNLSPF